MPEPSSSNLNNIRILFVDDEQQILRSLQRAMSTVNCDVITANSAKEALQIMSQNPADIVVSDMRMPEMSGEELLKIIANEYPDTIRFVLTGHADIESVLMAINQGHIWGYLEKPWDNEQLIIALEQAIFTEKILSERNLLKKKITSYQLQSRQTYEGFIGSSAAMQAVYRAVEYSAPSNASVFITGSSGTGKEITAAAIHNLSQRKNMNFVALNCAAIPKELMESEIFGHTKGAFSGAINHREGAASQANRGTLFFDEIGEMDIGLQAKLLRFIQTGQYQKVGSDKVETVDIRFISATNRNPLDAIKQQRLREDLYYRLNVISIHLPNLHERENDAVLIAEHFLKTLSRSEDKMFVGIDRKAEKLIRHYTWPGNVRQLENAIHSAIVMSDGPLLSEEALMFSLNLNSNAVASLLSTKQPEYLENVSIQNTTPRKNIIPLAEVERLTIERAISLHDGNVVAAASALGVSPSTLYRKIQAWQN